MSSTLENLPIKKLAELCQNDPSLLTSLPIEKIAKLGRNYPTLLTSLPIEKLVELCQNDPKLLAGFSNEKLVELFQNNPTLLASLPTEKLDELCRNYPNLFISLSTEKLDELYQKEITLFASLPVKELIELYQKYTILRKKVSSSIFRHYDEALFEKIRKDLRLKDSKKLIKDYTREAEDIKQEFFINKFDKVLEKYDPKKGNLDNWINKCVENFVVSALRKQSKQIESFQMDEEEALHVAKKVLELDLPHIQRDRQDVQRIMIRVISLLSKIDQYVIDLYYRQDKSAEEIASILKVKPGTINSRLSRIRKRILKRLKQQGLDKEVR